MTHLFSKVMRLSYDLYQPIIMKKGGNIFYYKVYLQSLLRKFAVKTFNMPKSMSTIQNQISGCERSVKESLSQCAELVGDESCSSSRKVFSDWLRGHFFFFLRCRRFSFNLLDDNIFV